MTERKTGLFSRVFAGGSILVMLSMLLTTGGCGKGPTSVKGTVTYKGQTVKVGGIDLDSKPGRGGTIENGVVTIKDVPPGKWKAKFVPVGKKEDFEPKDVLTDKKIQDYATSGVEIDVKEGIVNDTKIEFK